MEHIWYRHCFLAIDETAGTLTLEAALDFETDTSHNITVTATVGTLSTDIDYTLRVGNVNDRAPIFDEGQDSDNIPEDNPVGDTIRTFIANPDIGSVTYAISGTDVAIFSIDSTSGALSLAQPLDFETETIYNITVTATEGALSSSLDYRMNVTNVNDNPPVFEAGQTEDVVEESVAVGTILRTFIAIPDDGSVTYTLSGTHADFFNLDPDSGELSLDLELDWEFFQNREITITATAGSFSSTLDYTINITNVNDNPPVFVVTPSTDSLPEDSGLNVVIGTFIAVGDVDSVTYSISGPDLAYFEIDSTSGTLTLAQELDFETAQSHSITVTGTAGPQSTDLNFVLTVTNVNDTAPVFAAGQTADSVAENTATGTTLRTFAATADSGTVAFAITGTDAAFFSIDESTGALSLAQALDFETATSHNITITATVGTLSSTLDYTLTVTNVNDNAPVFAAGQTADRRC